VNWLLALSPIVAVLILMVGLREVTWHFSMGDCLRESRKDY